MVADQIETIDVHGELKQLVHLESDGTPACGYRRSTSWAGSRDERRVNCPDCCNLLNRMEST